MVYFDRPGPVNTGETIQLSVERAGKKSIDHMVVPSLTGKSALQTLKAVEEERADIDITCVAFRPRDPDSLSDWLKEPPAEHWKEIPELKQRWEKWKEEGPEALKFDEDIKE